MGPSVSFVPGGGAAQPAAYRREERSPAGRGGAAAGTAR